MPRLIYKGNTTDNFGRFLPAPYIDRIAIYDTYVEIRLALFIEADEDEDEEDILEILKLDELTFYVAMFAEESGLTMEEIIKKEIGPWSLVYTTEYLKGYRDDTAADSDDKRWRWPYYGIDLVYNSGTSTTELLESTGDRSYWAYVRNNSRPLFTPDGAGAMVTFSIDEFSQAETTYTEDGKKILKFTVTTTDSGDSADVFTEFFTNIYFAVSETDGGYGDLAFGSARVENWGNINVYAFASTHDIADLDYSSDLENLLNNPSLLSLNTSTLAYEKVIEDNIIHSSAEIVWLNKKGGPYDQIPLQSISSQYYEATNYTHADIVTAFQDLVDEYETRRLNDSSLDGALNNISYVLSVYGEDVALLPQLNLLRKTFSSTSTATPVGRLYVRLRRRIYNANLTVVKQPQLFKQLIVNPKIVDNRTIPTDDFEYDTGDFVNWTYPFSDAAQDAGTAEGDVLYNYVYLSMQEVYAVDQTSPYNLIANGFFFFDYEKVALSSSVSRVYDVEKLQNYFGDSLINRKLSFDTISLYRGPSEYAGEQATSDDLFEANTLDTEGNSQMYMVTYGFGGSTDIHNVATNVVHYSNDGESETPALPSWGSYESYLFPRSFALPDGSLEGYRLACIEFQDIFHGTSNYLASTSGDAADYINMDEETGTQAWSYKAVIKMGDYTMDIAATLMIQFGSFLGEFVTYYDYASEACNFNETDGVFNQFFIDGMENLYGDNIAAAPWIIMPLLYCIHADLVSNTFNGDKSLAFDTARAISTKISPYTGTLEEVISFHETIAAFEDQYYDNWEYFAIAMDDDDFDPTDALSGGGDIFDLVFDDIYSGITYPGSANYEEGNTYSMIFLTEDVVIADFSVDITSYEDIGIFDTAVWIFSVNDWNSDDVDYSVSDTAYAEATIDMGWYEEAGLEIDDAWSNPTGTEAWHINDGISFDSFNSYVEGALLGIAEYVDEAILTESHIQDMIERVTTITRNTTWAEYYNNLTDEISGMGAHMQNYQNYVKVLMVTIYPTMRVYSDLDPTAPITYAGYDSWL
jgi:hypothetical protein